MSKDPQQLVIMLCHQLCNVCMSCHLLFLILSLLGWWSFYQPLKKSIPDIAFFQA